MAESDGWPHVEEVKNGSAQLTLMGTTSQAQCVFDEHGWDGNGYDWGGVAQALVQMKMPQQAQLLFFDPEGDYLLVLGPDEHVLEELASWLRAAIENPSLLVEAMRYAEDHDLDGCTHE